MITPLWVPNSCIKHPNAYCLAYSAIQGISTRRRRGPGPRGALEGGQSPPWLAPSDCSARVAKQLSVFEHTTNFEEMPDRAAPCLHFMRWRSSVIHVAHGDTAKLLYVRYVVNCRVGSFSGVGELMQTPPCVRRAAVRGVQHRRQRHDRLPRTVRLESRGRPHLDPAPSPRQREENWRSLD